MSTKQIEALKLALEALDVATTTGARDRQEVLRAYGAIHEALAEQPAQKESVRLRRGDILRCIETDELCTVWSTSTTGRTLIKWSEGSFGNYTAEQIGDLFWLEPEPDDLELAAENSDNYAAFHAGYRFAVARSLAEQPAQQEPVNSSRDAQEAPFEAWWEKHGQFLRAGGGQYEKTFAWHAWCEAAKPAQQQEPVAWMYEDELPDGYPYDDMYGLSRIIKGVRMFPVNVAPPASKPWVGLTDEEAKHEWEVWRANMPRYAGFAKGIEAKLREKNAQPSKPLTDEQIIQLAQEWPAETDWASYIDFARAIEQAHGITGDQK